MKDDYYKKSAARAKQRAKILVERPDFQADILIIRDKFKLPPHGLKDEDSNEKWHDDFDQSADDWYEKVWLSRRHELIQLRTEGKHREADALKKQLNNEAPINALRIAIKKLLLKYKLPLNWQQSVRRYILFNDVDNMWLPGGVSIRVEYDEDTDNYSLQSLSIEIQDDTTIEDIKQAWSSIEFHQRKLHSYVKAKFQPLKKFDRDKRVYALQKEGKMPDEIGHIIEEEFGENLDYNDINIIVARHKKRLNIN